MFEIDRTRPRKKGASWRTRPEPTIYGNCDVLELHCRQKAQGAHPQYRIRPGVAALQHKTYSQLIHRPLRKIIEQVVGGLWISGGLKWDIPHHGSIPTVYALNQGSSKWILAIFVMSHTKS
jgi:hypothetical protein